MDDDDRLGTSADRSSRRAWWSSSRSPSRRSPDRPH
jgi:hypothetical protein